MKTVKYKRIKELSPLSSGNFGTTSIIKHGFNTYCLKKFKKEYPKDIVDNISNYTDFKYNELLLTPLKMVLDDGNIIGYLSKYDKNACSIDINDNYELKIKFLKSMKNTIELLHNEYGIVHCDIFLSNMLYNKYNNKAYLIDFDVSLHLGKDKGRKKMFRNFIKDYLIQYGLNFGADIYAFNVSTLMLLYNISCSTDLFYRIYENDINIENNDVKKLTKELLLLNTNKDYTEEYIIDYIR